MRFYLAEFSARLARQICLKIEIGLHELGQVGPAHALMDAIVAKSAQREERQADVLLMQVAGLHLFASPSDCRAVSARDIA